MKAYIERTKETKELDFSGSVLELLDFLKINSGTVLVVRNSELLTEDEVLSNEDSIKILSVISGG